MAGNDLPVLTPLRFIYMIKVRPPIVPTLKNCTSLLPFSFWGVRVACGEGGLDGTRASI